MIVNKLKVNDAGFPSQLTQIDSPPKQIYYAGVTPDNWLSLPKVAIVGSRKVTNYGRHVTSKLAGELGQAGVVVISGLAYGVDVIAHQAVLAVGGVTVAVMAGGLDKIYPAAHLNIANQISENGSLLSEQPLGSPIYKTSFIIRNRIVSGLADVLLITEAAINSGSLHTARFAMEQGKTVMVVPGNINSPASEGCNNLIKSGAIPVTDVSDVFFALNLNPANIKKSKPFRGSDQEAVIYELVMQGISAQEELALTAKMESPTVSSVLTMLEISGYIRAAGNGNWVVA